jgi:hypothetical protein
VDEDVVTIKISRRAIRLTLFVVLALLVIGLVVPSVLMSVGGSTGPSVVQGTPAPVRSHAVAINVSTSPTLGVVWSPTQRGYGRVAPSTVDNGGEPTGIVDYVRWQGWGTPRAVGTGKGWLPTDNPRSLFRRASVKLVASNLGTCHRKPAYRTIEWFFQISRRYRRGARFAICTTYPRR